MIRIIKELNIEVTKPNVFQALVAKQYDMNTRFLKVTLMDCGTRIDVPVKAKVVINARRKDGLSKGFDGVINEDGTVTVPLHSWMLELDGEVICDISVIDTTADDNKKLTTTSFDLLVEKAAYGGDDVTSDPQYDVLVELIERVESIETKSNNTFANALKGKASGQHITLNDVSPVEHTLGVKVESKNMIPYPYPYPFSQSTFTRDGITFTVNDDGTILINGTATKTVNILLVLWSNPLTLEAGTYTLSGVTGKVEGVDMWLRRCIDGVQQSTFLTQTTITTTETMQFGIYLLIVNGTTVENLLLEPKLERGSTATPYTPYISNLKDTTLTRYGKNLFNIGGARWKTSTANGITATILDDGGVRVTGTPINTTTFTTVTLPIDECILLPSGTYASNSPEYKENNKIEIFAQAYDSEDNYITNLDRESKSIPKDFVLNRFTVFVYGGVTETIDKTVYLSVEKNDKFTGYEPYIEPTTYTPNEDGTVEGVKSIAPNMTLIPNTSGITIEAEYNRDINKAFAKLEQLLLNNI